MNLLEQISFKQILTITFTLFAVIDILGSIPVLITLKDKMGKIAAPRATLVSGVLMLVFFFVGEPFLNLLGLDAQSFALAGSIVIFILGLEMILGIEFFRGDNDAKSGSIVPVAFPIIAGSGTLTTIMSLKANFESVNILIGILVNLIVVFITLKSLDYLQRILGKSGLLVIRKFFGIILIAIAVKIFRTNLGV